MDQRLWTSEESATTLIGSTEPASDIRRRTITPITEPDLDIKDRPRTPDSYLCLLVECHQCSRPPISEPDLDIEADRPKTPHSYLCQLVESHERPVEPQCLAQGKNDLHESLLSLPTEDGAVPNSFREKMLERLAFTISIAEGSSESLPCTEYCPLPPSPCLNPIASVHEGHSTSTDGSRECLLALTAPSCNDYRHALMNLLSQFQRDIQLSSLMFSILIVCQAWNEWPQPMKNSLLSSLTPSLCQKQKKLSQTIKDIHLPTQKTSFEKNQMEVWDSVILGRRSLFQTKPYRALRSYPSDDDIQRTSIEKILKDSLNFGRYQKQY